MKPKKLIFIFVSILFVFSTVTVFAQKTERDNAVALYKQGKYREAIDILKKVTKTDSSDAQSWNYLGMAYLSSGNNKDALKALKKAVELRPKDADILFNLAYANLMKNNLEEAREEAEEVIKLNPKSAGAHYIVGVVSLRNGYYNSAYDRAIKAISLNPDFTAAHLLKAESLVSSFVQQTGTVMKPANSRGEILKEAAEALAKYLANSPANKETKFYQEYLESVKFFADYYTQPENQTSKVTDVDTPSTDSTTPIKILEKPRPAYTDAARQSGITGVIRLMVGFGSDGNIRYILVVKPLSHGLNEEAVKAARKIKFEPATRNGKPIPVIKQIEYSFSIY